jgi:hypothetical protein
MRAWISHNPYYATGGYRASLPVIGFGNGSHVLWASSAIGPDQCCYPNLPAAEPLAKAMACGK